MPPKRSHTQKKTNPPIAAATSAMADCVLPQEIMFNIVTRLPVKSIHRFKAVCKPWCKVFVTPKFMKAHHAQLSRNRDNQSVAVYSFADKPGHIMSLYRVEPNEELPINLGHPYPKHLYLMDFVGCVNGLLCLACPVHLEPMDCQWIELWNPALKLSKSVPVPKLRAGYGVLASIGLGYDDENDDFKVVRIVHVEKKKKGKITNIAEVEVYSANSNSWKMIHVGFQFSVFQTKNQAIVNGNPYWVANADENDVLVMFDVTKMEFKIVPLTGLNFKKGEHVKVPFVDWKGAIAALVYDKRVLSLDVWVFDDRRKVWIKNCSFGPIEVKVDRFVQCLKSGEVVGVCNDGKLIVLDADGVKKKIVIGGADKGKFQICGYTESLAYFKGMEKVKAMPRSDDMVERLGQVIRFAMLLNDRSKR
ncbi:hypothetical protein CASFOL_027775 [Castilleja foliolosa]|uniref:F-box domain-containing protein n=1 Tax=Castilleja foliolosa TaxID=1961234 RepID=A0ABD3CHJ8_9LAMI